jgi:hypothetical protein
MDRAARIQKLYSDLTVVERALADFIKPRSADHPREWTQDEADKHLSLMKHRSKIVDELTDLEGR